MKDLEQAIRDAAEKYANTSPRLSLYHGRANTFMDGALSLEAKAFHQKGMYTEEEVLKFVIQAETLGYAMPGEIDIVQWFNENKK